MKDPTTLIGWQGLANRLRKECYDLKLELKTEKQKAKGLEKELEDLLKEYRKIEHLDQPHIHDALETLAKLEWAGPGGTCPLCKQHKSGMHAFDCLLVGAVC